MAESNALGLNSHGAASPQQSHAEYVLTQRPLRRVLAFIGRSIDDVVNDPIAKNQVRGYFKLYKQIERSSEVTELERQWNA